MRLGYLLLIFFLDFSSVWAASLEPVSQVTSPPCMAALIGSHQDFAGKIHLSTGRDLFVKVEHAHGGLAKGSYLLLHGLLDSHHGYDVIAPILIDHGFDVVRVDTYGFGRSLTEAREPYLDYRANVADLKSLLKILNDDHGIFRPMVAGHSMGGALLVALLASPDITPSVASRALALTPYIYRNDFYLMEKIATLGLGLPGTPLNDLRSWIPNALTLGPEYILDSFLHEPNMRFFFGRFYDELQSTRAPEVVSRYLQISAAIASVKGLRDLNSVAELAKVSPAIRLDLALAKNDQVVEGGQARKLELLVTKRGGVVHTLDSGHMVLDEPPNQVAQLLLGLAEKEKK